MAENEWSDVEDSDFLGIDLDSLSGNKNKNDEKTSTANNNELKTKTEAEKEEGVVIITNSRRRQRRKNGEPPLGAFRPNYLWVSDFCNQEWCEQHLEYTFTMQVQLVENPVMREGSSIHLARELAVQDVVQIDVTSREDQWAIKILNIIGSVMSFLAGVPIRREIHIFGTPFDDEVFIVGLIDEIRVDPQTFDFDIYELKTRYNKYLPSKAQKRAHSFQVLLYKKMFDDLVRGNVKKETVAKYLKLDLEKEFGDAVKTQLSAGATQNGASAKNLDTLLDSLFSTMQSLPFISQCLVEYIHQGDRSTLAIEDVPYIEESLKQRYFHFVQYWKGRREPQGVDIEEAWKCQSCEFAEVCEWRKKKALECQSKNSTVNQRT